MRLVLPSVSLVTESNPVKKIELVGRACYHSEDKITSDSALRFFDDLVSRQHFAMLEHATFVFEPVDVNGMFTDTIEETVEQCRACKYLNVTTNQIRPNKYLISGNLRAIMESGIEELIFALKEYDVLLAYKSYYLEHRLSKCFRVHSSLESIEGLSEYEIQIHGYMTFDIICDRGVSHELVRHRPASWGQESTRYCNYSKDKYGSELTFVVPSTYDDWSLEIRIEYMRELGRIEQMYLSMLFSGLSPQQARAILPNSLKTRILMTANYKEYEHFFNLRSRGLTGSPHPDMKVVADKMLEVYKEYAIKVK